MKEAKLSLDLATKMYNGKDDLIKQFALQNYPELEMKITDRIKTFEDALTVKGIQFNPPAGLTEDEINYMKMKIIVSALNEGWTPDWNNSNEYKYYPWFKMSSSGSGFSYVVCANAYSFSDVCSRLCFKSKELAVYAGKQFTSIYKSFYTI